MFLRIGLASTFLTSGNGCLTLFGDVTDFDVHVYAAEDVDPYLYS